MKAAIRTGVLGYTFSFITDYNTPAFKPESNCDQVYIKVKSAAINPVDYKLPRLLSGNVIGIDFSGTVEAVGSNNDHNYKVGDNVFGTSASGSLAEYCIADMDKVAKVPADWDSLHCAALPVAYLSALQSLRIGKIESNNDPSVNPEKSVLIIGASGGCGIAGIQLCKAMGVGCIVGICSKANSDFIREAGATEVVCYDDDNALGDFFEKNKAKFDCVYDAATGSGKGEDYWETSLDLLKIDTNGECLGEYVALNGPPKKWVRALSGYQKPHQTIMMMKSNSSDLDLVVSLLSKIKATPVINVVPFSDEGLVGAFDALKSRRVKGKIVFDLQDK